MGKAMNDKPMQELDPEAPREADGATATVMVSRLLEFRRARDLAFGQDLFGEPAWEILLALFISKDHGTYPSTDDIAVQINCYPSTMKRWLSLLVNRGLVVKITREGAVQYQLSAKSLQALDSVSNQF